MVTFYSTSHHFKKVSLQDAVFQGFAPDGSLYLPEALPVFTQEAIHKWKGLSSIEISLQIAKVLFSAQFNEREILEMVEESLDFPLPFLSFDNNFNLLELFHGPTFSFKDFGARFLASLTKRLLKENEKALVLVATTGDTGSAVGQAFYGIPRVHVVILYPKGRVTPSQEKQITTIGGNVHALEIEDTFDACQLLLKSALGDKELSSNCIVTTGNSINVARLIPQSFYYFYAFTQMQKADAMIVSVPSGNFGHLISGILAKRMGLPIRFLIGATNINDVVPEFLKTGLYRPHPSYQTIAVSMDVGNPSNFPRLLELYDHLVERMREEIVGFHFTDDEIRVGVKEFLAKNHYLIDPHTSVAYLALKAYYEETKSSLPGLFFATAHPAKFREALEPLVDFPIPIPEKLLSVEKKEKQSVTLSGDYKAFKGFLKELTSA